MTPLRFSLALGVVAATFAGAVVWQVHIRHELQHELEAGLRLGQERARLAAENRRLTAAQPTPDEVSARRAERSALTALLREIRAMKQRAEARPRLAANQPVPSPGETTAEATLFDGAAASVWRNAGRATPQAALETALWSAAGGDLATLAELLYFDEPARAKAGEIFGQLPMALQEEIGTPERLIALLGAADVPLGRAQILTEYSIKGGSRIALELSDAAAQTKRALLTFRPDGDRWQLVVPVSAVGKYAAQLLGSPKSSSPPPR